MRRRQFLPCVLLAPMALASDWNGEPVRTRHLRFNLTFGNRIDRELVDQRFWCYLPASTEHGQRLREVQVSAPYLLQKDPWGHRILELWFDRVPPLAQKVVRVTAVVGFDAADPGQVERGLWTTPERFIESDAPQIQALAQQLRRADELAGARAIFDWVRTNMRYAGYLAEDIGALQGLRTLRGDCTEYADLVVALARANGMPARMVGGYVTDRDAAPRPQDYHNWAEIHLGGRWHVVDAQKENWRPASDQYIAFRIYRDAPINPIGLAHRYRVQGELDILM